LVSGGSTSSLDDANVEMKYYHRMEREELRNYFATIRKSVLAELRGYPNAKNINQQQSKIADDAFENELRKRVDSGLIDNKILNAMADMPNASPKLACSAGKQILTTLLSMKGFGGELFLTKFVNSLQ
jgi:elongation factor P--beta-lysine ligase